MTIPHAGVNQWAVGNIKPPWVNDPHVQLAWQARDRYMTYSGGFPHISSWGAQKGGTPFTAVGGTVNLITAGNDHFGSVDAGMFDADAVAALLHGNAVPFSIAFTIATLGTQVAGRFGFAFAYNANSISTVCYLVFTGTNSNFKIGRRNDANFVVEGSEIAMPNNEWHTVEIHFDGVKMSSYFDGVLQDNAITWPGGACASDTFCLASAHRGALRQITSTARFSTWVITGGSTWPTETRIRNRDYLIRLAEKTA